MFRKKHTPRTEWEAWKGYTYKPHSKSPWTLIRFSYSKYELLRRGSPYLMIYDSGLFMEDSGKIALGFTAKGSWIAQAFVGNPMILEEDLSRALETGFFVVLI